jgi:hypothetical protein
VCKWQFFVVWKRISMYIHVHLYLCKAISYINRNATSIIFISKAYCTNNTANRVSVNIKSGEHYFDMTKVICTFFTLWLQKSIKIITSCSLIFSRSWKDLNLERGWTFFGGMTHDKQDLKTWFFSVKWSSKKHFSHDNDHDYNRNATSIIFISKAYCTNNTANRVSVNIKSGEHSLAQNERILSPSFLKYFDMTKVICTFFTLWLQKSIKIITSCSLIFSRSCFWFKYRIHMFPKKIKIFTNMKLWTLLVLLLFRSRSYPYSFLLIIKIVYKFRVMVKIFYFAN